MVDAVVNALAMAAADPASDETWIRRYAPPHADRDRGNQFLVMLKPEIVTPTAGNPCSALQRVWEMLAGHGMIVGAVRLLTSRYVQTHDVIARHYPTLNAVARLGLAGLSPPAQRRLYELFPDLPSGSRRVVGAFDLLATTEGLTPFALEVLSRNLTVHKVGTGAYAMGLRLDDEDLIVLNPFHPQQIAHFTTPGGAVALLECWSERGLSEIRKYGIGAIDPRTAESGSVRRVLYNEQDALGLRRISTGRNGVHMSPGPVEAMASMVRYFSAPGAPVGPGDTVFGRQLAAAGISPGCVRWALGDPYVDTIAHQGSLFEVTEDLNWDAAARLVSEVGPC